LKRKKKKNLKESGKWGSSSRKTMVNLRFRV
jgi:hypothetical protein